MVSSVSRVMSPATSIGSSGLSRSHLSIICSAMSTIGLDVALHRPGREARQQDVVGGLPQRVDGVGGEEPRAHVGLADLALAGADELVEAGVVAEVLDHVEPGDDVRDAARGVELEDRAVLVGQLHDALDQPVRVDVAHVADDGQRLRSRDVRQRPGRGCRAVGAGVVMARSSGQDAVVAGVAGGAASLRTRRSWRRSTTATSSTQAGRTSRLAGWSVAVISSQVAST